MSTHLPIEYLAIVTAADGSDYHVNISAHGWNSHPALRNPRFVGLSPIRDPSSPVLIVELGSKGRELVLFSRVFGTINRDTGTHQGLFRIYCLGWKDADREVRNWIYPNGLVVCADHPPFVDALIAHYSKSPLPMREIAPVPEGD